MHYNKTALYHGQVVRLEPSVYVPVGFLSGGGNNMIPAELGQFLSGYGRLSLWHSSYLILSYQNINKDNAMTLR
jgi:hypothetical protein